MEWRGSNPLHYHGSVRLIDNEDIDLEVLVKTILVLAANPIKTVRFQFHHELSEIQKARERSINRDMFKVEVEPAANWERWRQRLLDCQPEIVHFVGHGLGADGLVLEAATGQEIVSGERLARLLMEFPTIRCVVLNACHSKVQAEAIFEQVWHVGWAIGMRQTIAQESSQEFAIAFYDGVFSGKDYGVAFRVGKTGIKRSIDVIKPHLFARNQNDMEGDASVSQQDAILPVSLSGELVRPIVEPKPSKEPPTEPESESFLVIIVLSLGMAFVVALLSWWLTNSFGDETSCKRGSIDACISRAKKSQEQKDYDKVIELYSKDVEPKKAKGALELAAIQLYVYKKPQDTLKVLKKYEDLIDSSDDDVRDARELIKIHAELIQGFKKEDQGWIEQELEAQLEEMKKRSPDGMPKNSLIYCLFSEYYRQIKEDANYKKNRSFCPQRLPREEDDLMGHYFREELHKQDGSHSEKN
jgi:hypothetical protein